MAAADTAPTRVLVVTTGTPATPVLTEPVRLVDETGADWTPTGDAATTIPQGALTAADPVTATRDDDGVITIGLKDGAIPDAPTWANISGKPAAAAAIADLTDAPTAEVINSILAALRSFGVIAK